MCAGLLGWTPYDAVVDGVHAQVDALDAVTLLTGLDPFAAGTRSGRRGRGRGSGAGRGAGCAWCGRAAAAGWCPACAVLLEHAGLLAGQILLAAAGPVELEHATRAVTTARLQPDLCPG